MSAMQLYNTLSRQKQVFTPIDPSHVRVYACGPLFMGAFMLEMRGQLWCLMCWYGYCAGSMTASPMCATSPTLMIKLTNAPRQMDSRLQIYVPKPL